MTAFRSRSRSFQGSATAIVAGAIALTLAAVAPPLPGQSPPAQSTPAQSTPAESPPAQRTPARPGGTAQGSAVPPPAATPGNASATTCGPGMMPGGGQGMRAADTNGDGRLSRTEFTRFHERMFESLPKGADGQVALDDAMRPGGMRMGPRDGATGSGGARGSAAEEQQARGSDTDAAASSTSAPSSTPSSTSPQEAKPGQRQARRRAATGQHGLAAGAAARFQPAALPAGALPP